MCSLITVWMLCSTKCYKPRCCLRSVMLLNLRLSPSILFQVNSSLHFKTQPKALLLSKVAFDWHARDWGRETRRKDGAQSYNEVPKSCFVGVFPGSWDTLSVPKEMPWRMSRVSGRRQTVASGSRVFYLTCFQRQRLGSAQICPRESTNRWNSLQPGSRRPSVDTYASLPHHVGSALAALLMDAEGHSHFPRP